MTIPITINGISYPSKTAAYQALGISKPKFNDLIRFADVDKAIYDYLHPYGVWYKEINEKLGVALSAITKREEMYERISKLMLMRQDTLLTAQKEYVLNGDSRVTWECRKCKAIHTTHNEPLLRPKHGCGFCSKSVKDPSGMVNVLRIVRENNGVMLSEHTYHNRFFKYDIQCSNGHSFKLSANELINKHRWCPRCNGRPGENTARHILQTLLKCKFAGPVRNLPWLKRRTGRNLELDGYCETALINGTKKRVAFEYQGAQHYFSHWGGNEAGLNKLRERDVAKAIACEEEGVLLIPIRYFKEDTNFQERVEHIKAILRDLHIQFEVIEVAKIAVHAGGEKMDNFRNVLLKRGIQLLTADYRGVHGKYDVYCPKHQHQWSARYSDLHPKYRSPPNPTGCPLCGRERTVAATHSRYPL